MNDDEQPHPSFSRLERHLGRVLKHMSAPRMLPFPAAMQPPATDVFESADEIIIFMELPGVDPESISVIADQTTVTVSGERLPPSFPETTCIHQLEIEHGKFSRIISLPTAIDVSATTSSCKNGFLKVVLPKHRSVNRITVQVD
ncbi:MAG: Hsp20/alpha crystallin family protein [Thermodesulfobacteriota bacterium]